MRIALAAASAFVLAPTSAFAVDYLSADQAAKMMFPDADGFESREVTLDAAQMQQLAAQGVQARSAKWPSSRPMSSTRSSPSSPFAPASF